jgi:hypothetical protein
LSTNVSASPFCEGNAGKMEAGPIVPATELRD